MRYSTAAAALVLGATSVFGQMETRPKEGGPPSGCVSTYPSSFEITVVQITEGQSGNSRRGLSPASAVKEKLGKRQNAACMVQGTLVANLKNGVLLDSQGRTGSIVANRQFQFDPEGGQAGAIYTGGFSVCSPSNYLALGDSTIFYQCQSGDFFNLYDQAIAEQCQPVYIEVIPCDGSGMGMSSMNGVGTSGSQDVQNGMQIADGQLQVNQIVDGQVQNGGNVNQIVDGQVQNGGNNANQIADGQIQNIPANQITDGQIQGTGPQGPQDNPAPSPTTDVQYQAKRQLEGGVNGDMQERDMGGEEILTATESSTNPTEAGANLAHESPNAAVPNNAKGAFAGLAAAAAGYAALI